MMIGNTDCARCQFIGFLSSRSRLYCIANIKSFCVLCSGLLYCIANTKSFCVLCRSLLCCIANTKSLCVLCSSLLYCNGQYQVLVCSLQQFSILQWPFPSPCMFFAAVFYTAWLTPSPCVFSQNSELQSVSVWILCVC